jgi:hypothetical protein
VTAGSALADEVVAFTRRSLGVLADQQRALDLFRGDDLARAERVDPEVARRSLESSHWPVVDAAAADAWEDLLAGPGGDLLDRLALDDLERLVVFVTSALEIEPTLGPMVACLTDLPSQRHATVSLLDAIGQLVGAERHAVRRALQQHGRMGALQLVVLHTGASSSFGDRVVMPDEWLLDGIVRGVASRPVHRDLEWIVGKPGTDSWIDDGPTLCSDPDLTADAAAWAAERRVPAFAVVRLTDDEATEMWERDPLVVAAARQCLAEGAALILRGSARSRAARPSCEALADLGVRVGLHDPHAASFPLPAGWHRPARARGPSGLGAGDVDAAWTELSRVATRLRTDVGWEALLVAEPTRRHLLDVAAAIDGHAVVMDTWGFGARPGAAGIHILFNGPSGTGKTLASRVLASVAGFDLWRVDLARITDKYLGETEKHLDRLLTAAAGSGAMLLFDEAEAIFGRRGETHEARDRWANLEVAYLLQRIEEHPGVTVLTTNLGQQLDPAFDRRIGHRVEFALPDAPLRRRLWRDAIPTQAPLDDPADLEAIADRFELSGGSIRNAALNAGYAAAAEVGVPRITLAHLVRASVRELAKSGRPLTRSELGPYAALLEPTTG